jgi:hypothetical protein
VIDARLVRPGPIPSPQAIAPYRHTLSAGVYEVVKVLEVAAAALPKADDVRVVHVDDDVVVVDGLALADAVVVVDGDDDTDAVPVVDDDALIDDVGFTFPFDSYADKDLILVGDAASVLAGDASKLDTGALLLRNGAWARAFVQRLEHDIKRSAQPPADVVARSDLVAAAITRALQERPEDAERVRERGREGGRRAAGPPPFSVCFILLARVEMMEKRRKV